MIHGLTDSTLLHYKLKYLQYYSFNNEHASILDIISHTDCFIGHPVSLVKNEYVFALALASPVLRLKRKLRFCF